MTNNSSEAPEILIAEDSPVETELARRCLDRAGYRVTVTGNGEEALNAMRVRRPALVMSDVRMPLMDGYALCRTIKYDDALWDVPVILLTMLSEPEDILEAINSGADGYVVKPFVEASLLERIRALLVTPVRRKRKEERRSETVEYNGKSYAITGGGQQMLNLLLSVYENTLSQNRDLTRIQTQLNLLNESLDGQVRERTAALTASEEKYRALTETTSDWVWEVDAHGAYSYVSPKVLDLLGYAPEEVLGKTLFDFMPEAVAQEVGAAFRRVAESRQPFSSLENECLRKDGRRVILETSGVPVLDEAGNFLGYRGIDRDITERKRHEAEIARLNTALRTLSACNVTLVHAKSEEELFRNVCRHIVEIGGHRLAWVSYPGEAPDSPPVPFAHAGDETLYQLHAGLDDHPEHRRHCLSSAALRERSTKVCNRLWERAECAFGPLREAGVAAILALPMLHNSEIYGVLTVFSSTPDAFSPDEIKLVEELAGDLAYGIVTLRTRAERDSGAANLRRALEQAIAAIALTLEKRDPYTAGHQQRVAEIAAAIAAEMGLPPEQIEGLRFGALIHDIGKIAVPAEILSRPGRLSELEFGLIKAHSEAGHDILKDIPFPWPVAQMVHQHHERLDGSGYPLGLKGEEIMLEARILAVADVVEAMAAHRPYRAALGMEAALKELERGRCALYDPDAVDASLRIYREKGLKSG